MKTPLPPGISLLTNPKVLKWGGIIVGGLIGSLILRHYIKKIFNHDYDQRSQEKELRDIGVKDYNITITEGEATLITQNIFNAMNQWGTDEDTIIRNLESLQTKDDLLLIIKKFGIKPYNGTSMTESKIRKWISSRDLNMNGWLQEELGGKDLQRVIEIYQTLGVQF